MKSEKNLNFWETQSYIFQSNQDKIQNYILKKQFSSLFYSIHFDDFLKMLAGLIQSACSLLSSNCMKLFTEITTAGEIPSRTDYRDSKHPMTSWLGTSMNVFSPYSTSKSMQFKSFHDLTQKAFQIDSDKMTLSANHSATSKYEFEIFNL